MSRTLLLPLHLIAGWSVLGLACPLAIAQAQDAARVDSTLPHLLQPVELIPPTSRVIGPEVMRRRAVTIDAELLMTLDPAGSNFSINRVFHRS